MARLTEFHRQQFPPTNLIPNTTELKEHDELLAESLLADRPPGAT
jgi:hypothetical protein